MSVTEPPPGVIDWTRVDRTLCEAYHLTPHEIDQLTLAEIAVLCRPGPKKDDPPTGVRNMSDSEMFAEARRWHFLSPAEKIEEARRNRDGQ